MTVIAGGELTFLIGTLRVLNGAPVRLNFNVTIDVTPDPVIELDATGMPVVTDSPSPSTLSLSLSLPVHIAVIPEPASWLFVAIGVVVLWPRVRVMKAAVLRGKT